MDWAKFVAHLFLLTNIGLAAWTIARSVGYTRKHPAGKRRIGALLLIVLCCGYVALSIRLLVSSEATHLAFGPEMLLLYALQTASFVAAEFLLSPNPKPVVDEEDVARILTHFETANCAYAIRLREEMLRRDAPIELEPVHELV